MVPTRRLSPIIFAVLASLLLWTGCADYVSVERSDVECSDTKDNDGDGLVDCDDPDCRARPTCTESDASALDSTMTNDAEDVVENIALGANNLVFSFSIEATSR